MNQQALMQFSRCMRLDILGMVHRAGKEGAHLGGCLSLVEIFTVLYSEILHYDPKRPDWKLRDRVILSKAHASIALYAAMHAAGIYSDEEIQQPLYGKNTFLYKHSRRNLSRGLEMSGGSLGQGLPFGVGIALALLTQENTSSKVYVILGDGECNEGSIWEAAALAGHHKLRNLTVIIDKNQQQLDGYTKDIIGMDNMAERWESFGFKTCIVNGHNYQELLKAFQTSHTQPLAIIANTIKGKGISFVQLNQKWHANYLTDELYQKALEEVKKIG